MFRIMHALFPLANLENTSRSCHFTNKTVRDKAKKVTRVQVNCFAQKKFQLPRTPHFANTDLSNFWKTRICHSQFSKI